MGSGGAPSKGPSWGGRQKRSQRVRKEDFPSSFLHRFWGHPCPPLVPQPLKISMGQWRAVHGREMAREWLKPDWGPRPSALWRAQWQPPGLKDQQRTGQRSRRDATWKTLLTPAHPWTTMEAWLPQPLHANSAPASSRGAGAGEVPDLGPWAQPTHS